jgi:hypothetical protein
MKERTYHRIDGRAYVVEKTNLEDLVNHYNLSVFDSIIMTPTNGWAQGIIRGA